MLSKIERRQSRPSQGVLVCITPCLGETFSKRVRTNVITKAHDAHARTHAKTCLPRMLSLALGGTAELEGQAGAYDSYLKTLA